MRRVKSMLRWSEPEILKERVNICLNNLFLNKGSSLKNQIENRFAAIFKELLNGYYVKSRQAFNQIRKNSKRLISRFIVDIDKLSRQRPDLSRICNILKGQVKKIKTMRRDSLKQLQKFGEPNKNLSLFEKLLIHRERNLPKVESKSNSQMIKSYKIKGRGFHKVKLQIADIYIQIGSKLKGEIFTKEDRPWLNNFIYKGTKKPHIILKVEVVDKLPKLNGAKILFLTIHPESNKINWDLYKRNGHYILRTYTTQEKKQHLVLNSAFDKGVVYVLADKEGNLKWKLADVIYDALQIILINHLTQRDGIFVHALGLKDIDNKGIIFIGKTGSGKSTLAHLWHRYSRATILNDDRIIIRKIRKSFFIYGCPWHGDFSDYRVSKINSAKLLSLLFIHHRKKNSFKPISKKEAFNLLYPNLFPAFWDKRGLSKDVTFCEGLIKNLPCYSLGFSKDKEVIDFVRRIK